MSGVVSGRKADPDDPKGLIREAFRIDGITAEECRSIFLDWALSMPAGADAAAAAARLRQGRPVGHPMTAVLDEGARAQPVAPKRRGGSRARGRPEGQGDGAGSAARD